MPKKSSDAIEAAAIERLIDEEKAEFDQFVRQLPSLGDDMDKLDMTTLEVPVEIEKLHLEMERLDLESHPVSSSDVARFNQLLQQAKDRDAQRKINKLINLANRLSKRPRN
jgi:hypothetical protein